MYWHLGYWVYQTVKDYYEECKETNQKAENAYDMRKSLSSDPNGLLS